MNVQREDVLNALRAEDVAQHLGITGAWRGYWMRSSRCGEADHNSDAFALKRDGHWHCYSCDKGGDLLGLVALGAGLDIKADFPAVLELAAQIAGIDYDPGADLFGTGPQKPAPKPRVELPPQLPLSDRIALAKKRAAWAWSNLSDQDKLPELYLSHRGLDPAAVLAREDLRSTPLRVSQEVRRKLDARDPSLNQDMHTLWYTMGTRRGTLSMVCPVRSVTDGSMVDLRARRVEPEDGQPKILGMVGGITSAAAERGKTRQLIGCYGRPHAIDSDLVCINEGILDYLTALQLWPNAQVLGAVEAGTLALVVGHVAAALAARDNDSKLLIVEQADPPRLNKATGKMVAGAADQAINEDPNAATKVALRILRRSSRVGWLYCSYAGDDGVIGSPCAKLGGKAVKDLNDLVVVGADVRGMVQWWPDASSAD